MRIETDEPKGLAESVVTNVGHLVNSVLAGAWLETPWVRRISLRR